MSAANPTPAEVRAARFDVLVTELRALLARSYPHLSDETVLERAVHIAAYRLAGGNLPWSVAQ